MSVTDRRNTPQRQLVLDELKRCDFHPTAHQLHEATRRRLPQISLGTVYRNLELLVQMGLVRKLEAGGGEARFDGNTDPHQHVRCVRCGRMDDLHGVEAPPVGYEAASLDGYEILGYRLEFVGVCPGCRRSSQAQGQDAFQDERKVD